MTNYSNTPTSGNIHVPEIVIWPLSGLAINADRQSGNKLSFISWIFNSNLEACHFSKHLRYLRCTAIMTRFFINYIADKNVSAGNISHTAAYVALLNKKNFGEGRNLSYSKPIRIIKKTNLNQSEYNGLSIKEQFY